MGKREARHSTRSSRWRWFASAAVQVGAVATALSAVLALMRDLMTLV